MPNVRLLGGLMASASLLAVAAPATAQATAADKPIATNDPKAATVSAVEVTGSRVIRNGNQAPTPVTVLTASELVKKSPGNIPDALNQLPQFLNSYSQYTGKQTSTNLPVGNFLNLRGLGTTRSLILLDGQRVPPTSYDGSVDVNTLPQFLIQRVDVVTGGASAAYGSDAVVGVVNFILDKNFTGFKSTIQGGTSKYGDADSVRVAVAAGGSFFDDRLHAEGSFEHYRNAGIPSRLSRPPYNDRYVLTGAGTAANPLTLSSNVGYRTVTFGGLIRSGPLAGYTFLPNGDVRPMDLGVSTGSGGLQIGGDGGYFPDATLVSTLRTDQAFGRVSYEITPAVHAYAQAAFGESRNTFNGVSEYDFAPSSGAITIFSGNAFLNPSVRAALGSTPSFLLGRIANDFPANPNSALNDSLNISAGLDGTFARGWKWNLNYARGDSRLRGQAIEQNNIRMFAAADAVMNSQGQIVCRVTITNPGLYPGCVPIDLFGEGAPSHDAIAYVTQPAQYQVINRMDIVSANLQGEPISLWAGPVSVAVGAEYRRQTLNQTSNDDVGIPPDFTGIRGVPANAVRSLYLNMGSAHGSVHVKEAYAEVLVPLLRDLPWARRLDLNAAFRHTDYSTSGGVNTWKVGLSYEPTDDLRLRATASRDIRAPDLYELYAGGQVAFATFNDPHTAVTSAVSVHTAGNPKLTPEIGSTLTAGFVYSPKWAPGFTASVDAYQILITDAIAQTNAAREVSDCEASGGTASVCQLVTRPLAFSDRSSANFPTQIRVAPQNLSKIYQEGVDFESSYHVALDNRWADSLDFRLLLTYVPVVNTKLDAKSATLVEGGYYGNAKLRGNFTVDYEKGPFSLSAQLRSTGKFNMSTSRGAQVYADHGVAPNRIYTDLTASYRFEAAGHDTEAFVTINNLFNTLPPVMVDTTNANPGLSYPTLRQYYDMVGRYVTVGIRFRT